MFLTTCLSKSNFINLLPTGTLYIITLYYYNNLYYVLVHVLCKLAIHKFLDNYQAVKLMRNSENIFFTKGEVWTAEKKWTS